MNLNKNNDGKSPSKIKKVLLIMLCILLSPLLLVISLLFGIPIGIIWFIFFRKKAKPKNRKKYTIIMAVIMAISVLFYVSPSEEDTKNNSEITMNNQSETQIETELSEIINETQLLETEQNSQSTEELVSENTLEDKSEQNVVNNQPIETQKPIENETPAETPKPAESQKPAETPTPVETQKPIENEEPEKSTMVWIPQSGSKYHSRSSCSNMKNPRQVTEESAINMGYEHCKRCY